MIPWWIGSLMMGAGFLLGWRLAWREYKRRYWPPAGYGPWDEGRG